MNYIIEKTIHDTCPNLKTLERRLEGAARTKKWSEETRRRTWPLSIHDAYSDLKTLERGPERVARTKKWSKETRRKTRLSFPLSYICHTKASLFLFTTSRAGGYLIIEGAGKTDTKFESQSGVTPPVPDTKIAI